jgi:hypothetical protein
MVRSLRSAVGFASESWKEARNLRMKWAHDPKSDGAVLLVDMRCEPLLGRATEEVARVGDLGDVVGKRCFIGVENQTLYASGLETLGDLEFSEFEFEEFLDVATISEYLYPCQKNSL